MQCYTFQHGTLVKGINVVERDGMLVVFGGEEGLGRRPFSMRLHNQSDKFGPPDIQNGLILKAYPRRVNTKSGRTYVVLAKPTYGFRSKKYLVRIYTGASVSKCLGSWTILDKTTEMRNGKPVEFPLQLAVGWGGIGENARVSRWYDGMFVMAPGNAIQIKTEDGEEKVMVNVDGRLDLISPTEHMMLTASRHHKEPPVNPEQVSEEEQADAVPEDEDVEETEGESDYPEELAPETPDESTEDETTEDAPEEETEEKTSDTQVVS